MPVVTLGQGHEKVIQYILPDLYILCPKDLRFSSKDLMREAKFIPAAEAAETNWKHKVTPDWGDLKRLDYSNIAGGGHKKV